MIMEISGRIILSQLTKKAADDIKSALTLDNPAYWRAVRKNPKAKYALSPVFKYYVEKENKLIVGRGLEERIKIYCRANFTPLQIIDARTKTPAGIQSTISLRPYQVGIPEEIVKNYTGIVRLGTGFGKTIIGLRVAELLGQKTLIVVPTLDILNLFYEEVQNYFGTPPGVIQGKNFEVKDVTVATIQSLKKAVNRGLQPDDFGTIIVDECHKFISKQAQTVFEYFTPTYFYGLTATADRSDGQGKAIGFYFGNIIVSRELEQHSPKVEIVEYPEKYDGVEYYEIIEAQTKSEERNRLIVEKVKAEISSGRKVLILTKRIAHYEIIKEKLLASKIKNVFTLNSKDTRKNRAEKLLGLRSGETDFTVLLGTFSLLGTGIDIPRLDTLILAGDLRSEVLTKQSAGRIRRILTGKKQPKIIDLVDTGNRILHYQGKQRSKFYKSEGWKII